MDFDGYLCLPCVDEQLLCKIHSKVRQSAWKRVAWKTAKKKKTTKERLRLSLGKPKCPGGKRCHTCKTGFTGDCTQKRTWCTSSDVHCVQEMERIVKIKIYLYTQEDQMFDSRPKYVSDTLPPILTRVRQLWMFPVADRERLLGKVIYSAVAIHAPPPSPYGCR